MMLRRSIVGLVVALVASTVRAQASAELAKPDTSILLIRDPVVQAELKLNDRQRETAERAVAELDALAFALRDSTTPAAARQLTQALQKAERRLDAGLSDEQYRRLQGIVLRAQGYAALFELATARRLDVTPEQQKDIRRELEQAQGDLAELSAADAEGGDGIVAQAAKLREREAEERIHALLTPEQQKRWGQLRGAPFDLDTVRPPAPRAPELDGIEAWFNTNGAPPTLASLRGKVVVVHFWTFGDKACLANLPWYVDWQRTYASRGLVVIGVHTPEFPNEQELDAVAAQISLNKIEFAVAVDNQARTWTAWANPAWPAIYLVDRRGNVRLWWYGELNRPGAPEGRGPQFMQRHIEALLDEK